MNLAKLFAVIIFASVSNAIFALDFALTNKTSKEIRLYVSNGPQSAELYLQPGEMHKFGSEMTSCLVNVSVDGQQVLSKITCHDQDTIFKIIAFDIVGSPNNFMLSPAKLISKSEAF